MQTADRLRKEAAKAKVEKAEAQKAKEQQKQEQEAAKAEAKAQKAAAKKAPKAKATTEASATPAGTPVPVGNRETDAQKWKRLATRLKSKYSICRLIFKITNILMYDSIARSNNIFLPSCH